MSEGQRHQAAGPERVGASDEAFWQGQESRLSDQLGQPCCTLSGMCTLLGQIRGPLAVILHGERDCGNSFVFHRMAEPERFFSTNVSEEEVTRGQTDAPLEACLRLVIEELDPEVVLVLHSCLLSMVGSDPRGVIERLSQGRETPIVFLDTGGLRLGSQAEMADWIYATLAALPQGASTEPGWRDRWRTLFAEARHLLEEGPAGGGAEEHRRLGEGEGKGRGGEISEADARPSLDPQAFLEKLREALATASVPRPPGVNLIGLQHSQVSRSELGEALGKVGVELRGVFPEAAPLAAWQRVSQADLNVVVDRGLYPRLLAELEERYGMDTLEVPMPVGLSQTDQFYALLGERLGVGAALGDAVAAHREAARVEVERFRARAEGLRVAIGLRMLNNFAADQLAYGGLGDLGVFVELGLDITLLVQGPPEAVSRFEALVAAQGCRLPIQVFPSPWVLAPLLREGRFDVAYLADHAAEEARKAGVPMMRSRSFELFHAGIASNLNQLGELLALGRPARASATGEGRNPPAGGGRP